MIGARGQLGLASAAAVEQRDAHSGLEQRLCDGNSGGAASDDDDVGIVGHGGWARLAQPGVTVVDWAAPPDTVGAHERERWIPRAAGQSDG